VTTQATSLALEHVYCLLILAHRQNGILHNNIEQSKNKHIAQH